MQDLADPVTERTAVFEIAKSMIRVALGIQAKEHAKELRDNGVRVVATVSEPGKPPTVAVQVDKAVAKGALKLVPFTTTVGTCKLGEAFPTSSLPLRTPATSISDSPKYYLMGPPIVWPKPGETKKPALVHAWCVKVVQDKALANMTLIECLTLVNKTNVSVPIFTNTKDVESGAELVIYLGDKKKGLYKDHRRE